MALPNPALTQIPGGYKYGWHDDEKPLQIFQKGLDAETVAKISRVKDEPIHNVSDDCTAVMRHSLAPQAGSTRVDHRAASHE